MVWIIGSNTHGGGRGSQAGLGAVSHSAGLAKSLPTQRELLLRRESLGEEPHTGQKWPGPGATASHHLCWAQQRLSQSLRPQVLSLSQLDCKSL